MGICIACILGSSGTCRSQPVQPHPAPPLLPSHGCFPSNSPARRIVRARTGALSLTPLPS
eukprot:2994606-Rhodomonas_salina.1